MSVALHHEIVGDGPLAIAFHGNGLDHTYLRPGHDDLGLRVVYHDQRGYGRSARIGPYEHATWQADAIGLLDRLGAGRALLVGHSYGAWLALGCALRYPDRVTGLVLCGASPAFDYADDVVAGAHARDPEIAERLFASLATPPDDDDALQQLWREILPLYFAGPARHDILSNVQFGARAFVESLGQLDFSFVDRLHEIRVPVLILVGAHDFMTPPSQARRLAASIAGARVVELERSGHFPFVEEPDAYREAITTWLRTYGFP